MTFGWRRSVFGALALRAAVVALLAVVVLRGVTLAALDHAQAAALARAVDTDLVGLADIYASGGRSELLDRLADRDALSGTDGRINAYRVEDAGGARLYGRLAPIGTVTASAGRQVTLAGTHGWQRATQLGADARLAVAHADPAARALRERLARNFLFVGIAIVMIVSALAAVAALRLRARIVAVSGGLAAASPVAVAGDEIDLLAARSQEVLERQRALTDAYRRMADTIAHEIRTPLSHLDTRLRGFAEVTSDAERQAIAVAARADVRAVITMLASLLDIATSEAHAGSAEGLVRLDLSALTAEVLDVYSASLEEAGLRLTSEIERAVTIDGDPAQLRRLLSNLLDNVVRYVSAGNNVKLTVASGPRITVADTGPGLPKSVKARLFERFSAGAGGHGLGLALVRAIVVRHGWTISVSSDAKGTCFIIEASP